ncbi:hypothetical protein VTN77DRAFT_8103 [Rasamsonia byssochlamydoides]|uniref:uncharacterized protein n=1 Tax=Rasamsonia byssochlamydoides TaxID=89139 RepID=UPI003743FBEB
MARNAGIVRLVAVGLVGGDGEKREGKRRRGCRRWVCLARGVLSHCVAAASSSPSSLLHAPRGGLQEGRRAGTAGMDEGRGFLNRTENHSVGSQRDRQLAIRASCLSACQSPIIRGGLVQTPTRPKGVDGASRKRHVSNAAGIKTTAFTPNVKAKDFSASFQ